MRHPGKVKETIVLAIIIQLLDNKINLIVLADQQFTNMTIHLLPNICALPT